MIIKYIDETSWDLQARLKKHKRDIKVGNLNNALLQDISQSDQNFDFNSVKMPIFINNKRLRRGGASGVMVIVVGNGHGHTGSNLDETDCLSHSTNTLGKGMNPIILPPAMGK